MRGIKVGNLLMYRNSYICLISRIISNGENSPAVIVGIDSNLQRHEGSIGEWSTVIGRREELGRFCSCVSDKILQGKETNCSK